MVAVAIGGAALVGAGASIYGSNKAADAQKNTANIAAQTQRDQYNQIRGDLSGYREAGGTALGRLSDAYGFNGQQGYDRTVQNFRQDPGYQFALNEGLNAATASQAAHGIFNSGGTLKALQERGQGLADQGYNNYLGRLQQLMTTGQNSAVQTGAAGQNAANNISAAQMNAGNATASGYINSANSVNNLLGNLAGTYGAYKGGAFSSPSTGSISQGYVW